MKKVEEIEFNRNNDACEAIPNFHNNVKNHQANCQSAEFSLSNLEETIAQCSHSILNLDSVQLIKGITMPNSVQFYDILENNDKRLNDHMFELHKYKMEYLNVNINDQIENTFCNINPESVINDQTVINLSRIINAPIDRILYYINLLSLPTIL